MIRLPRPSFVPELWRCIVFGHAWEDKQPAILVNSPHRRIHCKRPECDIFKWKFSSKNEREVKEIEAFIGQRPANRSQRRAMK